MLKSKDHPCKGLNCTDPNEHSLECEAQHAAAVAGGEFVQLNLAANADDLLEQLTAVAGHLSELLRKQGDQLTAEAERHRVNHEPHSVSPKVVPGMVDYALAGIWLSTGTRHLDESLPNGQRERSRAALQLVKMGAAAMEAWMAAVGHIDAGEQF